MELLRSNVLDATLHRVGLWKRNSRVPAISSMDLDAILARLPWRRIFMTIAIVLMAAWFIGFGAGLIVRFAVPWQRFQ
jgi:hypothetical protein